MKKRLCDLTTLILNDADSAIFAVKHDVRPMDLISLGAGFFGDETLFRVSKHPDTVSVTIFRESEPPFTTHMGEGGTTLVSESMKAARGKILECAHLDFGIYTHGHYKGHSFNDLVHGTLGDRTLDSERRYELVWGSGPYASLFVNKQHVALIDYDDVERWMSERNVKRIQKSLRVWERSGIEMGVMERAERVFEHEKTEEIGRDDMNDWKLELRSGIEWMVRYEGNDVIEGYVPNRNDGSRVAEVVRNGAGLFVGMVGADVVAGPERWFDDALDKVYGELQFRTDLLDRFVWHDLTGEEGIYKLGEHGGKVYIANAFWSDVEPGYANMGVFEVDLKSESLEILTSGFYNGYLTIEECVERESLEVAPLDAVKLEHICSCNWEFDNFTEFAEALDEHDLMVEEVLGGPSRDEIAALKQEVIDVANERTNDAFDDVMTYERAVRFFDEPGLGMPMFIEDKVRRIEKLEEPVQDAIEKGIAAQIDEARTTSESMIDENRLERSTPSVEDLER